ncbi:MAG: PAS domain S-box protein [Williamsia sp.]|nr:PAS domain S-box protein [Williamsia sp.]
MKMLEQREERQTFLLNLSDSLRVETGVEAVGNRAVQLIAERLQADRVYLVRLTPVDDLVVITHEIHRKDMPPLLGTYRSSTFPSAIKELFERTIVYTDVRTDSRLNDLDRLSFAGLGAVGFMAASIRRGNMEMIWAAGAVSTTPRSWTSAEVTLFEDAIERTWVAIERARTEEALHESELKYRSLFDSIDEGLEILELIYNEAGHPVDFFYIQTNPAFERQTGLLNIQGKYGRDVSPNIESYWFEAYDKVVKTGEPVRLENYNQYTGRWYSAIAMRVGGQGSRQLAILFTDVTERKSHEQRQEFLLKLSDTLRAEPNVDVVANRTLEMLCEQLRLDRCYIAEYRMEADHADVTHQAGNDRVPPLPEGGIRLSDFPEALHITFDRTLVIEDFAQTKGLSDTDRENMGSLGLRALVAATLRKGEKKPHWVIVAVSAIPRRWTQGEIALLEEVTERTWAAMERVRAESALRDSEERLRTMIENLPGGAAFILDHSLRYTLAGGEALLYSGLTEADFIGKTPLEIVPQLTEEQIINYRRTLAGYPFTHEHEAGARTFVTRGVPLRNAAGEIYAALAVSYDITDRKHTEEQLRMTEERYRIALQSAHMGAWDWNVSEDKVRWNDQYFLLLGLLPQIDRVLDAAFFLQFIYPDDLPAVSRELQHAVEESGVYQMDAFRIIRADNGEVRWMCGYGRTVSWQQGKSARMVGVMYDITERKHLEQQKDEFMNIASHELKTPVTSLSAYAELLQDLLEEEGNKEHAELIKKLNNQVHRLNRLISDLLDTTKISAGQLSLRLETFNLDELIHERATELQHLTSNHIVAIGNCPPVQVKADQERISQVLTNLISNAIKYSPHGGEVLIDCHTEGHEVIISVQDHGIGIPAEMQAQVFERFFRAGEVKQQNYAGLGLGLYITAGIVHRHGGKIWVESEPGKGSTFYFTLPY